MSCQLFTVIILKFVVGVNDGYHVSVQGSRVGTDDNLSRYARREGGELLKEFLPLHDAAVLVHVDGITSQHAVPQLGIARRDGIEKCLVLGTKQLRDLRWGFVDGGARSNKSVSNYNQKKSYQK